jgi:hypothetical protein
MPSQAGVYAKRQQDRKLFHFQKVDSERKRKNNTLHSIPHATFIASGTSHITTKKHPHFKKKRHASMQKNRERIASKTHNNTTHTIQEALRTVRPHKHFLKGENIKC